MGSAGPAGSAGSSPPGRPALAELLDLEPHPEGGWFRQTWVSPEQVTLPDGRVRPTATLIHFLLDAGERSAWHRVASDEVWLAHRGTVRLVLGGSGGHPVECPPVALGADPAAGEAAQVVVPAGVWQRTLPSPDPALVSCLVSPGFDFEDFELAPRARPEGRGSPRGNPVRAADTGSYRTPGDVTDERSEADLAAALWREAAAIEALGELVDHDPSGTGPWSPARGEDTCAQVNHGC